MKFEEHQIFSKSMFFFQKWWVYSVNFVTLISWKEFIVYCMTKKIISGTIIYDLISEKFLSAIEIENASAK